MLQQFGSIGLGRAMMIDDEQKRFGRDLIQSVFRFDEVFHQFDVFPAQHVHHFLAGLVDPIEIENDSSVLFLGKSHLQKADRGSEGVDIGRFVRHDQHLFMFLDKFGNGAGIDLCGDFCPFLDRVALASEEFQRLVFNINDHLVASAALGKFESFFSEFAELVEHFVFVTCQSDRQ